MIKYGLFIKQIKQVKKKHLQTNKVWCRNSFISWFKTVIIHLRYKNIYRHSQKR